MKNAQNKARKDNDFREQSKKHLPDIQKRFDIESENFRAETEDLTVRVEKIEERCTA